MILFPKILFPKISSKLKLEVSNLEYNKYYANKLLNKTFLLKSFKEKNLYKKLNLESFQFKNDESFLFKDFFVTYIISISFLKANTVIHISDSKGNVKNFYTSGSVNLIGKQKKKREIALLRLISLIVKKSTFLGKKPLALHLTNVRSHKSLIIKKLKQNFFIKIIKSFNTIPFNGCRKKKIRRKKYSKKPTK